MDNQLKKLTAEIKAAFVAALSKKEFAETVAQTKASDGNGTFEVIISTSDRDRQGDIVMQDGWNLENYKANPVVLWAHDYYQLPIGVCDSIEVRDGKLVAKGRFAAHEFAQSVRALYDAGMLRATSVGFIPTEYDGSIIIKAELLEFSFVPVPANPMALSLAAEKKLDVVAMFVKGLLTKEVDAEQSVEPQATEPATTEPDAVEPEPIITPTDEETAPASEPSADDTITTAPIAEETDGTIAAGGDNETTSPQPEVETPAEDSAGAGEVVEKAADGDEEQEETTEMAAFVQLQTALQSVQAAAASDTVSLDDLKAAVTTATAAMLEVVNQLIADEQAEMDDEPTTEEPMTDSEKAIAQKAGRTLSKKTRTLLENTLAELKTCVAAVDELLKNADAEGGEGKATAGKADAQNEPIMPQGYAEIKAALKQYSENREVLRLVATSVSSALERINKSK